MKVKTEKKITAKRLMLSFSNVVLYALVASIRSNKWDLFTEAYLLLSCFLAREDFFLFYFQLEEMGKLSYGAVQCWRFIHRGIIASEGDSIVKKTVQYTVIVNVIHNDQKQNAM